MGPVVRYLGPDVPDEVLIWQDPVPAVDHPMIDEAGIAALKTQLLTSGLTIAELVRTAWASASTFRGSDKRGGANGARIRLAPQNDWEVNEPAELRRILSVLESVRDSFESSGTRVSLADVIVLGGAAAIEEAARRAGHDITVPFSPGRTDATPEQTDAASFAPLEPTADAFRNYLGKGHTLSAEALMIDRAQLLGLTAPQLTVLLGGLRVLGANVNGSTHGVLTDRPETLTNDFFRNLLDLGTQWQPVTGQEGVFEGRDRTTGAVRWTGTRTDLIFGSNAQLRAIAEVYAADDAAEKFLGDFVSAWNQVINADRFDLA
jgi:catalase-peroxidase